MYIIFIVCKWNPHLCPNTVRHLTHNFSHLVETKYMYIHCSVECNLTTLYKTSTSSNVSLSFLLWNNYNLKFIRIERQLILYMSHSDILFRIVTHIFTRQLTQKRPQNWKSLFYVTLLDFCPDVVSEICRKYVYIVPLNSFSGLVDQNFLEVPADVVNLVALICQTRVKEFISWFTVFLLKKNPTSLKFV